MKDYTIAVAGTGYVGLSIATLLSQHHKVLAVDIVPEKVELINNRRSPIQDEYIEKYSLFIKETEQIDIEDIEKNIENEISSSSLKTVAEDKEEYVKAEAVVEDKDEYVDTLEGA